MDRVHAAAGTRVARKPRHHVDGHWDLVFLKIRCNGWDIEIAAADSARFKDARTGAWREADIHFETGERLPVAGVELPVMPLAQLLDYKEALGREVDLQDVRELRNLPGRQSGSPRLL